MAQPSRLAALPGYDTAPDIYETPDDDTNITVLTQQTSHSPRSASSSSHTSDSSSSDDDGYGVSRRRLYPQRARSRFGGERVEARGVDLSDRVDGGRRGYAVKKRREREDEGLEVRLARLRREVGECRALQAEGQGGVDGGVEELGRLVAGLEEGGRRRGGGKMDEGVVQRLEAEEEEQVLGRVVEFDTRLAALEQALGISSLDLATSEAVAAPLIPSLTLLDQQLSALSSATSVASLEAASSRIAKLRAEATSDSEDSQQQIPPEDQEKLEQLYTLLPSLQSHASTVPALLSRLRSLKTLHTTAANAGSELEEVERRQTEMEKELKAWRQGLEKMETAVQEASEANGRNGGVVQGWVRDLEARVKTLGG